MKYIVLDTETTGVAKEDRIIQLAYLVINENAEVEIEETLCFTEQPIHFQAMAVHHITPEMITDKKTLKNTMAYNKLLELNTPDNYLIIQNAKFDLAMLEKEGFKNRMKLIDTLVIARHLLPEMDSHGEQFLRYALGLYKQESQLMKDFGIKQIKAHDAVGDVLVLWLLFQALKELPDLYARINNIPIFKNEMLNIGLSFDKFQEYSIADQFFILTQVPRLQLKFTFGKHKDRAIENIIQRDPSYVQWVLNKMDSLNDDTRFSLEYFMNPEQGTGVHYVLPEEMLIDSPTKNQPKEETPQDEDEQLSLFDLM